MGLFQTGLSLTQARPTFWPHPGFPPNSHKTPELQALGEEKVTEGHEDINYGVSESDGVE